MNFRNRSGLTGLFLNKAIHGWISITVFSFQGIKVTRRLRLKLNLDSWRGFKFFDPPQKRLTTKSPLKFSVLLELTCMKFLYFRFSYFTTKLVNYLRNISFANSPFYSTIQCSFHDLSTPRFTCCSYRKCQQTLVACVNKNSPTQKRYRSITA